MYREQSGAAALSGRDLPPDETLAANVTARTAQYRDSGAFPGARMDQLRSTAYLDPINGVTADARIAHGHLSTDTPDPDTPPDTGTTMNPDDESPDDGAPDDSDPGGTEPPSGHGPGGDGPGGGKSLAVNAPGGSAPNRAGRGDADPAAGNGGSGGGEPGKQAKPETVQETSPRRLPSGDSREAARCWRTWSSRWPRCSASRTGPARHTGSASSTRTCAATSPHSPPPARTARSASRSPVPTASLLAMAADGH
jgi:hypothetical protein